MTTYRYTDDSETAVAVIDDDGISRMSMLASALPHGAQVLPFVPLPPAVPSAVTMRQARLALLAAGLLDDVDTAIAAIADATTRRAAQIEWEFSNELQRGNPFVATLGAALDLTPAQVDALFVEAAGL